MLQRLYTGEALGGVGVQDSGEEGCGRIWGGAGCPDLVQQGVVDRCMVLFCNLYSLNLQVQSTELGAIMQSGAWRYQTV